jgi:hypothetical protein
MTAPSRVYIAHCEYLGRRCQSANSQRTPGKGILHCDRAQCSAGETCVTILERSERLLPLLVGVASALAADAI